MANAGPNDNYVSDELTGSSSHIGGIAAAVYGAVVYLFFLCVLLYAIGFVAGADIQIGEFTFVPKSIDHGSAPTVSTPAALVINVLLFLLFAVQHSVMARQGFKRVWTRIIPAAIERSTYVLASSLALVALFALWRPIRAVVWDVDADAASAALVALSLLGWAIAVLSTFLINHFDLFGLRQVYANLRRRELPPHSFVTPFFYRFVRHPLYVGFLIAFWATPTMTAGHLLFAAATTGYILMAVQFEERDLVSAFGADYRRYQRRVPMLVPGAWRRPGRP